MNVLTTAAYVALWLAYFTLMLTGAGLVVALFHAAFARPGSTPGIDAGRVAAGRWRALRRYGTWWLASAAAWGAGVLVLRVGFRI